MNFVLQFANWEDFLAMGKHGSYVWSSYLITLILLTACILLPLLKLKRTRKHLQRLIARQEARENFAMQTTAAHQTATTAHTDKPAIAE